MGIQPKTKAIVITEIISPYRIPVFNEIAKDSRIEFKVLFLAETEPERSWRVEKEKIRFPYHLLPGVRIWLPDRFPVFFNPGIGPFLKRENPDLIICGGYHHPSSLLALRYAKGYGKRFILWCESHVGSVRLKGFPFDRYRSRFIRASDGFLVPGKKAFDFITSFGVNGKKTWTAPNAVDNNFFSHEAQTFRLQKQALKQKRKFPSKIILYVGRLSDSKGVSILLEAFRSLPKSLEVGLILVGDGKDRGKYLKFCRRYGLKNVFFEGFKQQEELPFYYGLADLFVLPSLREEWGLVLNEALASGLPLIGTDVSGAAIELIEEGKNGFVVSGRNSEALKQRIFQILTDFKLQASMGNYSWKKSESFSPANCARGFIRAILDRDLSP